MCKSVNCCTHSLFLSKRLFFSPVRLLENNRFAWFALYFVYFSKCIWYVLIITVWYISWLSQLSKSAKKFKAGISSFVFAISCEIYRCFLQLFTMYILKRSKFELNFTGFLRLFEKALIAYCFYKRVHRWWFRFIDTIVVKSVFLAIVVSCWYLNQALRSKN